LRTTFGEARPSQFWPPGAVQADISFGVGLRQSQRQMGIPASNVTMRHYQTVFSCFIEFTIALNATLALRAYSNATMEPAMATIWELRLIQSDKPVVTEVFNNYDQARLAFEEIERKRYPVRAALIERIDGAPKFLRIFRAKQ
jgi:hypothetical protein